MKLFGWGPQTTTNTPAIPSEELPEIFPFPLKSDDFVKIDVTNIFATILTDVLERTSGIPKEKEKLLWDNCVKNESSDGLVTLLAKAMADMSDLFLKYDPAIDLIRKATAEEERQIKLDYERQNKSNVGIYISFKNYKRSQMIKIYSALEYCTVSSLHKKMNLSNSLQLKVSDLRASVSLIDSGKAAAQAQAIAAGLIAGRAVLLDVKDAIETATADMASTNSAIDFIAKKMSFYLGLPASYITGLANKTMGDTGEGDAKAVERGLKRYFFSIISPVCNAIFNVNTSFKSEDFYGINTALETLKTFELISEEYISKENKTKVVNKLFGFPEDTVGDEPEEVVLTPPSPAEVPNE